MKSSVVSTNLDDVTVVRPPVVTSMNSVRSKKRKTVGFE